MRHIAASDHIVVTAIADEDGGSGRFGVGPRWNRVLLVYDQ
jgi:hypothetical protein